MAYNAPSSYIIYRKYDIDAVNFVSEIRILTNEDPVNPFIPCFINLYALNISSFVAVPTITLGTNVSFDNLLGPTALTDLDTTNQTISIPISTPGFAILSLESLYIAITVNAMAGDYDLDIVIGGYYR